MPPRICFILPCYEEEKALSHTLPRIKEKYTSLVEKKLISPESRILFVDDGSQDNTWKILSAASEKDPIILALKLSRNYGHQNALLAGITEAYHLDFDATITMDADLQDDMDALDEFIKKYLEGYQVVYGVRSDRSTDSFFKRETALAFYNMMRFFQVPLVYNHADYRLLGRPAVEALLAFPERNLFLRGIIPLLGFPSTEVFYKRQERIAGHTKYPLKKMIAFALNGITSFSIQPIRLITFGGFVVSLMSIGILFYALFQKMAGKTVSGWTSVIFSLWFLGGLVLLSLGVIGEYIGRIYLEVKSRPRFFIEQKKGKNFHEKTSSH
ncbi:glycosyltransferase family 2 protein [Thermospira aquatica]|uniref:Glycosyltransferase family 2 protein n=1 Tax=Thermospira aquatica TaxID=2828656 RepID=A0AAX3BFB1_9SPIR|nr:glycosyltransferase family 2 protein [Thermospira aquatica]URA10840.1 glycosyltransferase family 2 protein [Thermospira aquatica]